jgi:hypothetical protein
MSRLRESLELNLWIFVHATRWYHPRVPSGQEKNSPAQGMRFNRYAIYSCFFLAWILLIFVTTGGRSDPSWLSNWQRWDGRWYEQIRLHGYPASDPRILVFPPGYPLIVGILSNVLFSSFIATGILLNLIAFFAAATLISEWFAQKFDVSPHLVFVFILSSPAAYFAFTSYSDLLFMLLLWLLLWLALSPMAMPGRKGLIVQAILLFVLPWIRITGYALASWLLDRRVVAVSVLGSLALWLGFNEVVAGSPFYFLQAQRLFAMPSGNLFQGLFFSLERLFSNDLLHGFAIPWLQFAFLPLFYFGALVAVSIWLVKKGESLLAITVLSILILSHNQGVWRSAVRYDLPILPVLSLPLLARQASRGASLLYKMPFYALVASQFALQIVFARIFHSGGWAF